MELILMSIAGTAALMVMQFAEFACAELPHGRLVPRPLARSLEMLTPTVTVATAYGG